MKSTRFLLYIILTFTLLPTPSFATFGYDFPLLQTVKRNLKSDYVEKDLDDTTLEYGAIKGMLAALDDPYTRFMEPKNFTEMKVQMQGEFYGIGIHIGMRDKSQLTVISPILGTPADKAGLKPLDKIMTIDGKSTKGLGLMEAVKLIRGERGSKVTLGILSKGSDTVRDVSIIRSKIKINSVDKIEVFEENIGYVRLTTFENQHATSEVYKAINELLEKDIQGLILDLRNNGGGLLRNAINIASLLMDKGDVVHTVNREGDKKTERVSGPSVYTKDPLFILINEGSASASEILAGAIKDNKRGTIIGKNSFGKASVQKILTLSDGSAVLFTIAKYLTPSGTDITKTGISVDIESDIPTENIERARVPDYVYTYDNDPQLQEAIALMKSKITEYKAKNSNQSLFRLPVR